MALYCCARTTHLILDLISSCSLSAAARLCLYFALVTDRVHSRMFTPLPFTPSPVQSERCAHFSFPLWSCSPVTTQPRKHGSFSSFETACSPLPCLQAELEDLVKQEHARIDSQDQSSESKGAPAKASSASAAPQHERGQE